MDLIERLTELFRLYRICLQLTEQAVREEFVAENEALADVVQRRTAVLARIKHLEEGLPTSRQDNGAYLLTVPKGQENEAEKLLVALQTVIADLIEADRKLRHGLEETLDRLSADLQKIGQGCLALKAYAPFRRSFSLYVDRQG